MENLNFTFTITSTDRCNAACTYCHYYSAGGKAALRNGGTSRRLFRSDIDRDTLEAYFSFIAYFKEKFPGCNIFYRFSGGDPLVLGDRLFEMANRGHEVIGVKPYVLTAGKSISPDWVEKAKRSSLSHACVSLENPLNPDPGAPNPHVILDRIKTLSTENFPLKLGLTVVRNEDFSKLYDVCEYVYNEAGILPNLAEINYDKFVVPTDKEIEGFQENIFKIFRRWYGKTPINVFAYVSPEIYSDHGGAKSYLIELDIHDPYKIKESRNYDQIIDNIVSFQDKHAYPKSGCPETKCPWYKNCERVKWHWVADYPGTAVTKEMRFNAYCKLKKAFMAAYYMAVLELGEQAV